MNELPWQDEISLRGVISITLDGESATSLILHKASDSGVFICVTDKEEAHDPTGGASYMEACEKLQVVPATYFLQHMHDSELSMVHRGLGPQVL